MKIEKVQDKIDKLSKLISEFSENENLNISFNNVNYDTDEVSFKINIKFNDSELTYEEYKKYKNLCLKYGLDYNYVGLEKNGIKVVDIKQRNRIYKFIYFKNGQLYKGTASQIKLLFNIEDAKKYNKKLERSFKLKTILE
jgi:hypothetical protein